MMEIEIARWGQGNQWIVSTDGDALTDQPKTERELEDSGRFFGPFANESAANEFAAHQGVESNV